MTVAHRKVVGVFLVEFGYYALISKRKTFKGYDGHTKSNGVLGKVIFKMSLLVHL